MFREESCEFQAQILVIGKDRFHQGEMSANTRLQIQQATSRRESATEQARMKAAYRAEILAMEAQSSNLDPHGEAIISEMRDDAAHAAAEQDLLRDEVSTENTS